MHSKKPMHNSMLENAVFAMAVGVFLLTGCMLSRTRTTPPANSVGVDLPVSLMPAVGTHPPTPSNSTSLIAPTATTGIATSPSSTLTITAPPGIVYTSNDRELWLIDKDGKSFLVTKPPKMMLPLRLSLSPDQTWVLYNSPHQCWIADLDIRDTEDASEIVASQTSLSCQWASDSKTIYYSDGMDIWKTSASSPEIVQNLTETSKRYADKLLPTWLAHPDRLFFYSWTADKAPDELGWIGALTTIYTDGTQYEIIAETIAVDSPAFSPAGQNLAYIKNHELWLHQLNAGSQPIDFATYGFGNWEIHFASPSWSPDGTLLAGWAEGRQEDTDLSFYGIMYLDLQAATARIFAPLYHPVFWDGHPPTPEWSPDGRWLVYWGQDEQQQHVGIHVIDIRGGEIHFLAAEDDTAANCANTWGPGKTVWSPDGHWLAFNRCEKISQTAIIKQGIWLAQVGSWDTTIPLSLPQEAGLVGWIIAAP